MPFTVEYVVAREDGNWVLDAGTRDDNLVDENPTNRFLGFQLYVLNGLQRIQEEVGTRSWPKQLF